MGDTDPVLTEVDGHVLLITLNRPAARNAMNLASAMAFEAALDRLDDDPELRVGILTGAGNSFCAGMDLKAAARGEQPVTDKRGGLGIIDLPPTKPLIAAVEGNAVGGGLELCLACDLVVAARGAPMGLPEAKRGLFAGGGGLYRLPNRIPQNIAMELALTGNPVTSQRMAELGLVNRLAEPGQAVAVARELAAEIAECAPLAVALSKQVISAAADHGEQELRQIQGEHGSSVFGSADATEGMAAFAEKRPPIWRGE